ncbi:MAG TPA: AMP-binding protein [Thermomicrobiales bacterium]|nr:AMP-binding protein [Thermomicrobiales bacterium]
MSTSDNRSFRLLPTVIHQCRRRRGGLKLADSTGAKLTGGETLVRALVLRRILRRHFLGEDERTIGVMLPSTVAGAVTNLALALDKRVSVNLNFMLNQATLDQCVERAGLTHIITSRKVLERLGMAQRPEHIILEDVPPLVGRRDKAICAAEGLAMPVEMLVRRLGLDKSEPDELFSILFTSGSTGEPKGVMLSHHNVASNCGALRHGIDIRSTDVLVGILPFFHAFGLTVSLWMPLVSDATAVYHTSPLEAEHIGQITRDFGGTILVATPTFLRLFMARCTPEQFGSLNLVATGAEPLRRELIDAFEARFGIRPFEGYGATETSPAIAFNTPPERAPSHTHALLKEGTVGRPIQDVTIEIRDRETGRVLSPGVEGLVWVTGPNIMLGYLDDPARTAKVVVDGWYNTHDIGVLDEDGFLTITGRVSQFSKIAGETVPHLLIERAIAGLLGAGDADTPVVAVTATPDTRKGERIVVVHTRIPMTGQEIGAGLREAGLPPLYIPSPDSFVEVDAIPVLPSGKVDLGAIRALAGERFAIEPVTTGN